MRKLRWGMAFSVLAVACVGCGESTRDTDVERTANALTVGQTQTGGSPASPAKMETVSRALGGAVTVHAQVPPCQGSADSPGEVTIGTAVPFVVPATIPVKGHPGREPLLLSFGRVLHALSTCRYAPPRHDEHAGKSPEQSYALETCDGGHVAGDSVPADVFKLRFGASENDRGDDDDRSFHCGANERDFDSTKLPTRCGSAERSADLLVDGSAVPVIPEAISPEETTSLRQKFSWKQTSSVRELDAKGRPMLYYALVLLENSEQVSFLDQLEIHHEFLPLFESRAGWVGRAGIFRHDGDGTGVFAFTLIPGQTYNLLRKGALAGTSAFNAVILRRPPAPFANRGAMSVSYDALARIKFRYRGLDPLHPAPPTAPILCVLDLDGAVKAFVSATSGVIKGLSNLVNEGIGDLIGLATGTNTVAVGVRLSNTDPSFNTPTPAALMARAANDLGPLKNEEVVPTPMLQAWGADAGFPIFLSGVRVESHGLSVPSYDKANLDAVGTANLSVLDDTETGFCLVLENDAADVIDLITSVDLCDFRTVSVHEFVAEFVELTVQDESTNVLAQLTDGANFAKRVMSYSPRQVHTLVGPYADVMPNALTPCFNLFNLGTLVIQPLLAAESGIAAITHPEDAPELLLLGSCIYDVDMMVPSWNGDARSRAVTTHEYGHWLMCNKLLDNNKFNLSGTYNAAILETVARPVETLGECDEACGNEGFADFIADQVAGATSYGVPNQSIFDQTAVDLGFVPVLGLPVAGVEGRGPTMAYCPSTGDDCFENNVGGPGQVIPPAIAGQVRNLNIERYTSVVHDFFDGFSEPQNAPSNGNFWKENPQQVFPDFTLDREALHGSRNDEPISLPGSDIQNIINNRRGVSIDQDAIFGGLADTAKARGYTWCDICKLFAVHDSSLSSEAASDSDKYGVCTTSPEIAKWLGPAPDPTNPASCNFVPASMCPPGQIVSSTGTCITPPCTPPLVLNFDNTCQAQCDKHFEGGMETDAVIDGKCVNIIP